MKLPKIRKIKTLNTPKKTGNNKKTDKQIKGEQAEQVAIQKLQKSGLTLLERNFHFYPFGEIDAIMQDEETLVFVEVRFRHSKQFVTPAETINPSKQQKIIKTALYYLQTHNLTQYHCRFDVVCVTTEKGLLKSEWLKSAFTA